MTYIWKIKLIWLIHPRTSPIKFCKDWGKLSKVIGWTKKQTDKQTCKNRINKPTCLKTILSINRPIIKWIPEAEAQNCEEMKQSGWFVQFSPSIVLVWWHLFPFDLTLPDKGNTNGWPICRASWCRPNTQLQSPDTPPNNCGQFVSTTVSSIGMSWSGADIFQQTKPQWNRNWWAQCHCSLHNNAGHYLLFLVLCEPQWDNKEIPPGKSYDLHPIIAHQKPTFQSCALWTKSFLAHNATPSQNLLTKYEQYWAGFSLKKCCPQNLVHDALWS